MQWVGVTVSCVLCTVHALLIMGFHGQQATIDFTIYLSFSSHEVFLLYMSVPLFVIRPQVEACRYSSICSFDCITHLPPWTLVFRGCHRHQTPPFRSADTVPYVPLNVLHTLHEGHYFLGATF